MSGRITNESEQPETAPGLNHDAVVDSVAGQSTIPEASSHTETLPGIESAPENEPTHHERVYGEVKAWVQNHMAMPADHVMEELRDRLRKHF